MDTSRAPARPMRLASEACQAYLTQGCCLESAKSPTVAEFRDAEVALSGDSGDSGNSGGRTDEVRLDSPPN